MPMSSSKLAYAVSRALVGTILLIATMSVTLAVGSTADAQGTRVRRPGPPTSLATMALDGAVKVTWSAPSSDGGSPVTGYVVTGTSRGFVQKACVTTVPTTCYVNGLDGVRYFIRVSAVNAVGPGMPAKIHASPTSVPNCSYLGQFANLSNCNLSGADLSNTDLSSSFFTHADLTGANLAGSNLHYSKLTFANLTNANLTGADLTVDSLIGTNLSNTILAGANLAGSGSEVIVGVPSSLPPNWQLVSGFLLGPSVSLGHMDFTGLDFTGVDLSGCLLYTSPSPRDRQKSRMPSSA